ncbi:MAG: hypothetical protein HQK49_09350 [Oligoflexia bacterium]|nr:hypothetical protein [Oligoflexia bacterium]
MKVKTIYFILICSISTLLICNLSYAGKKTSTGCFGGCNKTKHSINKNDVNWKLLFAQLFASEIKKEIPTKTPVSTQLDNYFTYSSLSFDKAEEEIKFRAKKDGNKSEDIYRQRINIFENNKEKAKALKIDFKSSISKRVRNNPEIKNFLKSIISNSKSKNQDENYFTTKEAQDVIKALSFTQTQNQTNQKVAIILFPGFAAQSSKDYIFEELAISANKYYGRPSTRPIELDTGITVVGEDYRHFYGDKYYSSTSNIVDILHPIGQELGNSIGSNQRREIAFKDWILKLPSKYKDTKLILVAHNSAGPAILDMLAKYSDVRKKVLGVVTIAGIVQGSGMARLSQEKIKNILENILGENIYQKISLLAKKTPEVVDKLIACLDFPTDNINLNLEPFKNILQKMGVDTTLLADRFKKYLETLNTIDIINGINDLTPYEQIKWHLKYFNNKYFDHKMFFMNLSALFDPQTLVRPRGENPLMEKEPSPIVPMLDDNGNIDWQNFSMDALYLSLISIPGFKNTSAGLFDGNVELGNSKSLLLDSRPLSSSLTKKELLKLWSDPEMQEIYKERKITESMLYNSPRNTLIKAKNTSNIHAIDLGEVLASSISVAYKQFIKLNSKHPEWKFPRMALMRALMQVLALYNLYQQSFIEDMEDEI